MALQVSRSFRDAANGRVRRLVAPPPLPLGLGTTFPNLHTLSLLCCSGEAVAERLGLVLAELRRLRELQDLRLTAVPFPAQVLSAPLPLPLPPQHREGPTAPSLSTRVCSWGHAWGSSRVCHCATSAAVKRSSTWPHTAPLCSTWRSADPVCDGRRCSRRCRTSRRRSLSSTCRTHASKESRRLPAWPS